MRAVVTRVKNASVVIDGETKGAIGTGFLVLLGVHQDDTQAQALKIADKICGLRVFEDAQGKMNVNPSDAGAELETGEFGADMQVFSQNDGPVTILLDTNEL